MGDSSLPEQSFRKIRVPKPPRENIETEKDTSQTKNPTQMSKPTSNIPTLRTKQTSKAGWSTTTKILVGVLITVICIIVIVAIVLAIIFLTRSNSTSSSDSTTVVTYVAWSFDNVTTDTYGVYNGQLMNGATYGPRTSTQPYLGQGNPISFTASSNQSFVVSSPFLDLTFKSFTIEAWIYPFTVTGDNGFMGQCQCASCLNQCFHFLIRSSKLHAGFSFNDLAGLTTLSVNTWYHVTFVYDSSAQQQILYLNGIQDNIKSNAAAYQGTNGSFVIGSGTYFPSTTYFNGYIDNVKITTRAKTASEVLTAASLAAYYSFDLPNPTNDNGPNGLNGTSVNAASVNGRVNQGLQFTGTSSYFRAYGFYQAGFGVISNRAFSIAMWVSVSSYIGSTFVQMSTSETGGSCFNMMGIWSYTNNAAHFIAQGYAWPRIYGSPVTLNQWTHLAWTFTLANGYRLYINGVYFGTTGYYSHSASGSITWLQLGYSFSCSSAAISNTGFQGIIDEVYIFNREITASEVYALANP